MAKSVHYDAFISYKHCRPDSEIAEKLHKKLENFRLPKPVAKKIGKSKLSRVFRDEAELAVSDNLSEEIEKALSNSKYLIAICSPEYLQSVWCMKEISTFLEYSDRKHILLVLANGEPAESFPEVLLYEDVLSDDPNEEAEYVRKPVEPLAADCRGENAKERSEKIDSAVVRLMAAICGVGYDDLKQRHKKAQIGKRRRRVLTAFGILAAVLAISLVFLIKISKQNVIINQKYADSLAITSSSLLSEGRRVDAVYAARQALPDNPKKGYSNQAVVSLVNALGIYDLPDAFSIDSDIVLPCTISEMDVSPSGNYVGIRGLNDIRYVISMASGYTVFEFREDPGRFFAFDGDRGFVFKREDETLHYMDFETLTETDLQYSGVDIKSEENGLGYYVYDDNGIDFLRGSKLLASVNYKVQIPYLSDHVATFIFWKSNGTQAYIFLLDYEYSVTYCLEVDFETGQKTLKDLACTGLMSNLDCVDDIVMWQETDNQGNFMLCKQDLSKAYEVKKVRFDQSFYSIEISGNDVIVISDRMFTLLNLEDLTTVNTVQCRDYIYYTFAEPEGTAMIDSSDNMYFVQNGYSRTVELPFTKETTFIMLKEYKNGKWFISEVGDNHLSIYSIKQSEYLTGYNGEENDLEGLAQIDVWYPDKLDELIPNRTDDFEEESVYVVIECENANLALVQFYNGTVFIYDRDTGERIQTLYSVEGVADTFYYDKKRELYYLSASNMDVFDKNLERIYTVRGCYMYGTEPETGFPIVHKWSGETENRYRMIPVSYEELIEMADELLIGYEPDERVKEQYSLE